MDFTSHPLADKPGGSAIVQDCILVLEYLSEDGRRERLNLDFLCTADTNKHDYHFVLQVWVWMFMHQQLHSRFDSIDVWSDGGPHHFKTRYCQWMWHALSQLRFRAKRITHHFFASYHGHSLADGHAAVIKRQLEQSYHITELGRLVQQPGVTWGPATVADVAGILRDNCSNTQVVVFNSIDRDDEKKPRIKPIQSIKTLHCLRYEHAACTGFERTGEGEGRPILFARTHEL